MIENCRKPPHRRSSCIPVSKSSTRQESCFPSMMSAAVKYAYPLHSGETMQERWRESSINPGKSTVSRNVSGPQYHHRHFPAPSGSLQEIVFKIPKFTRLFRSRSPRNVRSAAMTYQTGARIDGIQIPQKVLFGRIGDCDVKDHANWSSPECARRVEIVGLSENARKLFGF
jgi:hypothetical protein